MRQRLGEKIEFRRKFEALFADPDAHQGFFDRAAAHDNEKHFRPISQRIILNEPYATFFRELKVLREKMGRGDISSEDTLTQALKLEENAGLKGIVISDANDKEAARVFLGQMRKEVDALGFQPDYYHCYGGRDHSNARAELDDQIHRFFIPITNGLQLKPIEPVRREFDRVVEAIIEAVPTAVLGQGPGHSSDNRERPTITNARASLGRYARGNTALREAVEEFVRVAAGDLREDAHLVIDMPEEDAPLMRGVGGS